MAKAIIAKLGASLSPSRRFLLHVVADYMHDDSGTTYVGQTRLASDMGVSKRSVQIGLTELRSLGVLGWTSRGKRGGGRGTNLYEFTEWAQRLTSPQSTQIAPADSKGEILDESSTSTRRTPAKAKAASCLGGAMAKPVSRSKAKPASLAIDGRVLTENKRLTGPQPSPADNLIWDNREVNPEGRGVGPATVPRW